LLLALATILLLTSFLSAQDTETILFNFQGGSFGKYPVAFALDASGNIYGTLQVGGYPGCNADCGLVYKLSPNANGQMTETILHTFTSKSDGDQPTYLLMDAKGNLFVSAYSGGDKGLGAIVELSPIAGGSWSTKVLYDFTGGIDGDHPNLTFMDSQGNLYGNFRSGQVFELSRNSSGKWMKKFLYLFNTSSGDFGMPWAVDASGNVYGTAFFGGNTNCSEGCGIVFELSPVSGGGWTETTLYNFSGAPDGAYPEKMIPDGNGNFFGFTEQGGSGTKCARGCGTLFELSPSSTGYTESVLHDFNEELDGYSPEDLLMDSAGNLYVSTLGGVAGEGLVLKFTLASDGIWQYTTLHSFAGGTGGGDPYQLAIDSSGNVYGIAGYGGAKSNGLLYELSPPAAKVAP
jgi:hypothetical protein